MDTHSIGQLVLMGITSVAALSAIGMAVHFYWIRFGRPTPADRLPAVADDARLRRLEDAVDSIAIEVERISEGQRFLTRLQTANAEPSPARQIPAPERRAITPVA
jgi:hypothetical protein